MTATLRDRLKKRATGAPVPARPEPPERLPAWVTDATLRYARGDSLQHIADAIGIGSGAAVWYWLDKAGVRIRDTTEARAIRTEREREAPVCNAFAGRDRLTEWITAGRDLTLDRQIARIAAATTEDQARDYSAFTPGAIRTVTHG